MIFVKVVVQFRIHYKVKIYYLHRYRQYNVTKNKMNYINFTYKKMTMKYRVVTDLDAEYHLVLV
jgi:hypothetical protein